MVIIELSKVVFHNLVLIGILFWGPVLVDISHCPLEMINELSSSPGIIHLHFPFHLVSFVLVSSMPLFNLPLPNSLVLCSSFGGLLFLPIDLIPKSVSLPLLLPGFLLKHHFSFQSFTFSLAMESSLFFSSHNFFFNVLILHVVCTNGRWRTSVLRFTLFNSSRSLGNRRCFTSSHKIN